MGSAPCGGFARKEKIGLAVAYQELSGHDDQVEAMDACDPGISIPTNSSTADGEQNCKERENGAASNEKNAGWLPSTSSSNWMRFNNFVDGSRFQSNFTNFISFLQRIPRGLIPAEEENNFHAYRNFSVAAVVNFLEENNGEISKAASQKLAESDAFYREEMATLTGKHRQQVVDSESHSEGKIQELSTALEKVTVELSVAQAQVSSTRSSLNTAQSEMEDRKEAVQRMQAHLDEEKRQKQDLSKRRDISQKEMNAKRENLETKLRHSEAAVEAKGQEVHRLSSVLEGKEEAYRSTEAVSKQLTSECQKLKAELATIEQKSAQESFTSGSYTDDNANPGMLLSACQSVDTATDNLVRFLHENSTATKKCSLEPTPELESFIGRFSHARLADFSRPGQVKHVWGHWICAKMFQGFEHVFFDMEGERTSPLDFKKHAMECFQSFQQKKNVSPSDYYKACDMFRAFCIKMYSIVFPSKLVNVVLPLDSRQLITCEGNGRFDGDEELHLRFLDTAKAIWLLHQLSFSFDPPASILRMGWGTAFDKQYHESLIKDGDNEMSSMVVLMVRPAFRVRNTIIKSRVFLSKKLP